MINHGLLTDIELSKYLNVKLPTIRKWRIQKRGPRYLKLNGTLVRYRMSDASAWLDEQGEGPSASADESSEDIGRAA